MMRLTGTPSNQSRIGIAFSYRSLVMCGLSCRQVPFPIAQTAAFYGGETCGQRAGEHRCHEPKREFSGRLARFVGSRFGLSDDLVDTLFGIGLRQTGSRRNDLGEICLVRLREGRRS